MISAVSLARWRSDATMASTTPRLRLACSAWWRPRSVSGGSAWPCQRPSAFHSDCPWRTSRTRVMAVEPTEPARAPQPPVGLVRSTPRYARARCRGPEEVVAWPCCDCSRGLVMRRAPATTRSPAPPSPTCSTRRGRATARPSPTSSSTARSGATASRASSTTSVVDADEVAVLPPVSGGADLMATRQAGRSSGPPDERRDAPPRRKRERSSDRAARPPVPSPLRRRLRHRGPAGPPRDALVPRGRGGARGRARSPTAVVYGGAAAIAGGTGRAGVAATRAATERGGRGRRWRAP